MKKIKLSGLRKKKNDQAWFWSEEWQKNEREADNDIANNNVKSFSNAEDAISFLRSEKSKKGST